MRTELRRRVAVNAVVLACSASAAILAGAQGAHVKGHILDPSGAPTMGGVLRLIASHPRLPIETSIPATIAESGAFDFADVPPGKYLIQSYRPRGLGWQEGAFGFARITVGGSDVSVVLGQTVGSTVTGRVSVDHPPTSMIDPNTIVITPIPADFDVSPPPGEIASTSPAQAGWTFQLRGLHGPRRLQLTHLPPG